MNHSLPHASGTALVLGGGGSAGNAWLIGVIAGLFDAGLDATTADLIIGTSAGSTAAAQITGASPDGLLADILNAENLVRPAPAGPDRRSAPARQVRPAMNDLDATNAIIASAQDAPDMRRKMGAWSLATEASSDGARQAQWRATVASRLPQQKWPSQRMLITAVDADSGEPVVFDNQSGIDLADAVAASCSSGFAYRIGEHRYIDGGYRTNADNADLATGYARVLVLSPFAGRSRLPEAWGMHLATQVEQLRAHGSMVETIFPDAAAGDAFGGNMMNLAARPPAARAGFEQGKARAVHLAEFWRTE
ncbi:patatin-like phospholipase family protein [Leifsonia poae]|uniref:patatin-like phospholipase family protein n=1 Tax=Leifsonia poae TaxID=110933 RepID=UPI003D67839F